MFLRPVDMKYDAQIWILGIFQRAQRKMMRNWSFHVFVLLSRRKEKSGKEAAERAVFWKGFSSGVVIIRPSVIYSVEDPGNIPCSCIICSRYKVLAFVRMFHWLFVSLLILHWLSLLLLRSALTPDQHSQKSVAYPRCLEPDWVFHVALKI